ncbi:hypothetical protein [Actinomyces oris]|uniref:hypothetical protein n=1 Tax=Actinomyces oris TaxID=544580 RepID=UPI000A4BA493|nr:hypothetical protein [Actinomyces oris]
MTQKQLKVDYDAAQKVKNAFIDAESDLTANTESIPTSEKYGEGETYITFALTSFGEASGTFGQAADYGATAIRDGVSSLGDVDAETAANIRKLAEETPNG